MMYAQLLVDVASNDRSNDRDQQTILQSHGYVGIACIEAGTYEYMSHGAIELESR